jgi:hypothetical protein
MTVAISIIQLPMTSKIMIDLQKRCIYPIQSS